MSTDPTPDEPPSIAARLPQAAERAEGRVRGRVRGRDDAAPVVEAEVLRLVVDATTTVSALLLRPVDAWAGFVFAHGAGAGMEHPGMARFAEGLAAHGVATLRYQFVFRERGSRRPDPPPLAHAVVRAAVAEAARRLGGLPLVAGGRSYGGRMTSQAQSIESLPGVRGLLFIAFPLHPAGQPSDTRAEHLQQVRLPMLFVQGTRDELAALDLLEPVVRRLGERASLVLAEDADHALHVRTRGGRTGPDARRGSADDELRDALLVRMVAWLRPVAAAVEPMEPAAR